MTQPLVSIVTGYYNRLHDLEESIGSVLAQTYPNFEYIVFDDCSTDGTREKLEAIQDPRLRLIKHEHNIGFTRGIINAVKQARGEFIAVHGAGDISYPTRIEKQVEHLMANPGCVAVGTRIVQKYLKTGKVIEYLCSGTIASGGNPYTHGEVMFRLDAYKLCGGYREVFYFAQDRDLWIRLARYGSLAHIDVPLYERRLFDDGVNLHPVKRHLQGLCRNLAIFSDAVSRVSPQDFVERNFSLALLLQKPAPLYAKYSKEIFTQLFCRREREQFRKLIHATPLGMIGNRELLMYVLLEVFGTNRLALRIAESILLSPRVHARFARTIVRSSLRLLSAL